MSEAEVTGRVADVGPCSQRILALRDAFVRNNGGEGMGWQAPESQHCAQESGEVTGGEQQRSVSGRENRDPAHENKRTSRTEDPGRGAKPRAGLADGTVRSLPFQKVAEGGGYVRRLSLKELRLFIEDVYASKVRGASPGKERPPPLAQRSIQFERSAELVKSLQTTSDTMCGPHRCDYPLVLSNNQCILST